MSACEKCWDEAYSMMRYTGRPQYECYQHILKLKNERGEVCTQREQAGQFWDEEKQEDIRKDI